MKIINLILLIATLLIVGCLIWSSKMVVASHEEWSDEQGIQEINMNVVGKRDADWTLFLEHDDMVLEMVVREEYFNQTELGDTVQTTIKRLDYSYPSFYIWFIVLLVLILILIFFVFILTWVDTYESQ